MVVVVVPVRHVAMAVVQVVDMVTVRDGNVPAAGSVRVVMGLVRGVPGRLALVVVAIVFAVQMAVVHVVDVTVVGRGDVPAALAVDVCVVCMLGMCAGHGLTLRELMPLDQ